jgi:hypothetical protein
MKRDSSGGIAQRAASTVNLNPIALVTAINLRGVPQARFLNLGTRGHREGFESHHEIRPENCKQEGLFRMNTEFYRN